MLDYRLSKQELAQLRAAHRRTLNVREAYRINAVQLAQLDVHLKKHLHLTAESVARWVKERWMVCYAPSGMAAVLRRLGYVYKKPKQVPGKPNGVAQEEFLEDYENLKQNSDEDDVIMFMDATHPQHNPVISCGWIERGKEHPIKSNTGRRRLNINGAIDVQRMSAQIRFDDTIDAISTIALFEQIERANPLAKRITVICDNARC